MSGEHYENAECELPEELVRGGIKLDRLGRMIGDLVEVGAWDLAVALAGYMACINHVRIELERLEEMRWAMYGPLRAFNLWKSHDSSEVQFWAALGKWRAP